jgi:exonuclease VII large subunit
LKEKYNTKQLDKNVFIELVKKNYEDIKNQFQNINVNDLTTRGKTKKQQKEEELQKIQDAIDEENVKDEAEKQKQGAERLQQVKDEEAQELADKQQQLLAKVKMRKLKNFLLKNKPTSTPTPTPATPTPAPAPAPPVCLVLRSTMATSSRLPAAQMRRRQRW